MLLLSSFGRNISTGSGYLLPGSRRNLGELSFPVFCFIHYIMAGCRDQKDLEFYLFFLLPITSRHIKIYACGSGKVLSVVKLSSPPSRGLPQIDVSCCKYSHFAVWSPASENQVPLVQLPRSSQDFSAHQPLTASCLEDMGSSIMTAFTGGNLK